MAYNITDITISVYDGSTLYDTITAENIMLGGMTLSSAINGSSEFQIGTVIARKLNLTLNNASGYYNTKNLVGKELRVSMTYTTGEEGNTMSMADGILSMDGMSVSGTTLTWADATVSSSKAVLTATTVTKPFGVYYVFDRPEYSGNTVSVTALDCIGFLSKVYEPTVTAPCKMNQIYADIVAQCGINAAPGITAGSNVIKQMPDTSTMTCGQMMCYLAQRGATSMTTDDDGKLVCVRYGGRSVRHELSSDTYSLDVETEGVSITGVRVTECFDETDTSKRQTVLVGEDTYPLNIAENPLIQSGDASSVATAIANVYQGMSFRPMRIAVPFNPELACGDAIRLTDYKGNVFNSYIGELTVVIGGQTTITMAAASESQNASASFSSAARALSEAKRLVNNEATARSQAMAEFQKQMENAAGMYETQVTTSSGTIYYLHDKPELADSQCVMKVDSSGVYFSSTGDSPSSYVTGIDYTGNAVLNKIYAIGINADYINAGTITGRAISGGTITGSTISGGTVTGTKIDNGNGTFHVTPNGAVTASNLTITGGSVAGSTVSGTISGVNVSGGKITSGSATINNGAITGASVSGGSISNSSATALSLANDKFTVTTDGVITSTAGSIGGWTIQPRYLEKYNVTNADDSTAWAAIGAPENPVGTDIAFAISTRENTSATWTYPFRVNWDGSLKATKATIEGSITSKSGNIANWSIGAGAISRQTEDGLHRAIIQAGSTTAQPSYLAIAVQERASTSASWTSPFRVNYDGSVTMTKATITGGEVNISNATDGKAYVSVKNTEAAATYANNSLAIKKRVSQGDNTYHTYHGLMSPPFIAMYEYDGDYMTSTPPSSALLKSVLLTSGSISFIDNTTNETGAIFAGTAKTLSAMAGAYAPVDYGSSVTLSGTGISTGNMTKHFWKSGHVVQVFMNVTTTASNTDITVTLPAAIKAVGSYGALTVTSHAQPFASTGSMWISNSTTAHIYLPSSQRSFYVYGVYMTVA